MPCCIPCLDCDAQSTVSSAILISLQRLSRLIHSHVLFASDSGYHLRWSHLFCATTHPGQFSGVHPDDIEYLECKVIKLKSFLQNQAPIFWSTNGTVVPSTGMTYQLFLLVSIAQEHLQLCQECQGQQPKPQQLANNKWLKFDLTHIQQSRLHLLTMQKIQVHPAHKIVVIFELNTGRPANTTKQCSSRHYTVL